MSDSSLLSKLLVIMTVLFTLLIGVFVLVEENLLLPSFEQLEKKYVAADLRRAVNALNLELEHLDRITLDWAAWDDTYEYIKAPNPTYESINLGNTAFAISEINVLAFLDLDGRFVWVKAYDPKSDTALRINEFSGDGLSADSPLLKIGKYVLPIKDQRVIGLIQTSAGPMFCAVRPIIDSDMEAPTRGFLLMGRLLTEELARKLARQTESQLFVSPLPIGAKASAESGVPSLAAADDFSYQFGEKLLEGMTTYADVEGHPLLLLKVTLPREVLSQGKDTLKYAVLLFGAWIVVSLAAATLLLQRAVTTPVRKLTEAVLAVGSGKQQGLPLDDISGSREVRLLGREFSRLVRSLAEQNDYLGDLNRHLVRETEKLKQAEQRLNQLDQLKNEFISTAAHELRTPVASIMGYTELMADNKAFGPFSEEQKQDFLKEIYENSEGLTRIVDSILDVSRIESGQPLPLFREPVDLADLLRRVLGRFRVQTRQHELSLEIPDGLPLLEIDSQRLIQVMENLLSNAIKYSPAGGGSA